ncbi:recombinase family protein [Clostridium sporogenes]|uniref:recombinase family protein n=1 Tax=Clostridium sporogenes TaxID=1509 RepID=UPI0013D8925A|nr:recombinase family protein [Clostridium sporogenes]NFG97865.1 recombinase family protein [Clostridium sporogenes]NFR24935.1 recombinase family protein [Clostridium sporogenes]
MYKVVYYARVSTEEEGQKNALQNQIGMLEDFINNNIEWELVNSYIDEGKSGTTSKGRKEYNKLYEDLATDKFDIIVIKDLSRLNRNPLDYYKFIDRMVKNEKRLFMFSDNKFYESDDALINGIKAILAQEYSRDISKKVNAGHKQRQKKGTVITNGTTWGYDQQRGSKQLIINEEEAKIVRKIFNWYCDGNGFRKIFKLLEEEGVKNRNGKPFAMTTLKRIIKNEKYKGTLVCNKRHKDFDTKRVKKNSKEEWIIHENAIPAIVTEDIWNKANKILNSKKRKNNADKEEVAGYFNGTHLYSSKIICGQCNRTFWHTKARQKSKWQCKEYKSFGLKKENGHGCWNVQLFTDEIDDIVKDAIYQFWSNKDKAINNVMNILNKVIGNETDNNEEEILKKQQYKLEQKKSRLIDMLADDLITKNEYKNKKKEIDTQLKSIEEKLYIYEEKNQNIKNREERLNEIKNVLNKNIESKDSIDEEIIKIMLDKIIVKSEKELDIYLNPLLLSKKITVPYVSTNV